MAWVAVLFVPTANAELKSIGLGGTYGAPMGRHAQTFKPGGGVIGELLLDFPSVLGSDWMLHVSADYQIHTLRATPDLKLGVFNAFVGPESRLAAPEAPIRPFVSLEFGATYMGVTVAGSASNVQNGGTNFSMRWRSGFELPVSDTLSAVFALPITVVFKESYADWAAILSVRLGL